MEWRRAGAEQRDQAIDRVRTILAGRGDDDGGDPALHEDEGGYLEGSPEDDSRVRDGLAGGPSRARVAIDRRTVMAFAVAALVAAIVAGVVTWLSRPTSEPVAPPAMSSPEMSAVQANPAQTGPAQTGPAGPSTSSDPTTIVVSVIGYVATPGLVTLPDGARVADAIAACGGTVPGADLSTVNLARKLSDGEQIAVGVPGADPGVASEASGDAGTPATGAKVNINTASADDLDALPGIGPVIATRIVDFRTKNGKFASVDDLTNVSGIGPSIMSNIKDLVTV